MKNCDYCGQKNREDAPRCFECGTIFDQTLPKPDAIPVVATSELEPSAPEPDVGPDDEAALCISCLFPNRPTADWCKRCGASVNDTAALIMPHAARTIGNVYRRALQGRPKKFVFFGMWLIFFPVLFLNSLGLPYVSGKATKNFVDFYDFCWCLLSIGISLSMLYRITKNYFTVRETKPVEDLKELS